MPEQKIPSAGRREWLGLAALTLPTLLISIDTSVLYLALPKLSTELRANSSEQLWIMDIYSFMIAGFLITMGNLGDRLGYRKLLIIGSAAFGISSVLAAFSPNADILILARALMGISGATLMPSTLALIRNMFVDPGQRTAAISVWMSCFMAGMIIGPLIGGLVLEHFWWGAVFLLGVPLMMLIIFAGRIVLPEYMHGSSRRFDLPGVVFSLAAILPAIYGITEISRNNVQSRTVLLLIAGILFAIIFVRRELTATDPLIDFSLFKNKTFNVTLISMLLVAIIMGGIALFIAQYLQLVIGLTPFYAGLWMIPQALGMIAGSLVMPFLARKFTAGFIIILGFILSSIGFALLAFLPVVDGLPIMVSGFVLAILGVSAILILGTGMIISAVPAEKAGVAASISETANQLGIALGVALLGSIGSFVYRRSIVTYTSSCITKEMKKAIEESIVGAHSVAAHLGNDRAGFSLMKSAKLAFVSGFHLVAILGSGLFVALAFFTANMLPASITNK